ncbi:MAG: beta-ketoacyl-ACP synthase III [Acidimicrobiales bacterium]
MQTGKYLSTGIAGWGVSLPPKILTNKDLESRLDTSDAWIVERTGIRERRIGGLVTEMAVSAGSKAIESARVKPSGIELLVLATTTPDRIMPSSASLIHHMLGLSGGAFDLNAACAGFVYAYIVADAMMSSTGIDLAMVVGADCLSSLAAPHDRTTTVLFGDGAGALLLERRSGAPGSPGILGVDMGTDGSAYDLLSCPHQGTISMDGKEVFRRAIRTTVHSAHSALSRAGLVADDISLFVPHQANARIIQAACERLGIPEKRTSMTIEHTGNTSAASIPIALSRALDEGRVAKGDAILMSGFGAGMSWSSIVVRL